MAGFIGYHVAKQMLEKQYKIIGIDNLNNYYDVNLKYDRLKELGFIREKIAENGFVYSSKFDNIFFVKMDLANTERVNDLFKSNKFDLVIHLAAQAGVRYSLSDPMAYIESNIIGFVNILESCRYNNVKHLIYASSSSVYGLNTTMPFSVHHNVDHPVSLYAASKKSNELMAHTYSHLYNLPTTGLRFFTVYGPWGRPDMALFLFTKAILENKSINVFNNGNMKRDFTYIDDIVKGIANIINNSPPNGDTNWSGENPDPASSPAPYRIYNVGNNKPVRLLDFIHAIEKATGKKAIKNNLPLQDGDVPSTYADISDFMKDFGFKPSTELQYGIDQFVDWFRSYYKI